MANGLIISARMIASELESESALLSLMRSPAGDEYRPVKVVSDQHIGRTIRLSRCPTLDDFLSQLAWNVDHDCDDHGICFEVYVALKDRSWIVKPT